MSKAPSKQFGKQTKSSLSLLSSTSNSSASSLAQKWDDAIGLKENCPNANMNLSPILTRPLSQRRRSETTTSNSDTTATIAINSALYERDVTRKRVNDGDFHPAQRTRKVKCELDEKVRKGNPEYVRFVKDRLEKATSEEFKKHKVPLLRFALFLERAFLFDDNFSDWLISLGFEKGNDTSYYYSLDNLMELLAALTRNYEDPTRIGFHLNLDNVRPRSSTNPMDDDVSVAATPMSNNTGLTHPSSSRSNGNSCPSPFTDLITRGMGGLHVESLGGSPRGLTPPPGAMFAETADVRGRAFSFSNMHLSGSGSAKYTQQEAIVSSQQTVATEIDEDAEEMQVEETAAEAEAEVPLNNESNDSLGDTAVQEGDAFELLGQPITPYQEAGRVSTPVQSPQPTEREMFVRPNFPVDRFSRALPFRRAITDSSLHRRELKSAVNETPVAASQPAPSKAELWTPILAQPDLSAYRNSTAANERVLARLWEKFGQRRTQDVPESCDSKLDSDRLNPTRMQRSLSVPGNLGTLEKQKLQCIGLQRESSVSLMYDQHESVFSPPEFCLRGNDSVRSPRPHSFPARAQNLLCDSSMESMSHLDRHAHAQNSSFRSASEMSLDNPLLSPPHHPHQPLCSPLEDAAPALDLTLSGQRGGDYRVARRLCLSAAKLRRRSSHFAHAVSRPRRGDAAADVSFELSSRFAAELPNQSALSLSHIDEESHLESAMDEASLADRHAFDANHSYERVEEDEDALMNCDMSAIMREENENHVLSAPPSPSAARFDEIAAQCTHYLAPSRLVQALRFLSRDELLACHTVCKSWFVAALWALSDSAPSLKCTARPATLWSHVQMRSELSGFSSVKFLSEGACKQVYCLDTQTSSKPQHKHALSVMDVQSLIEQDAALSVEQELQVSMLCSALARTNICPNMICVNSVFKANCDPFHTLATENSATTSLAKLLEKRPRDAGGCFQYIRMEFCDGGDVESFLRNNQEFSTSTIRSFLFQMSFALYAGREALSLRHFDVKLLNFFLSSVAPNQQSMRVGFGEHVYAIPASECGGPAIVKLADFGTSSIGEDTMNTPISAQQFTTLENTPPEYLLWGSETRQCPSADTFCLGLCFVHLLTGHEPYEVHLDSVRCPTALLNKLQEVWMLDGKQSRLNAMSRYFVVHEVVSTLVKLEGEPFPIKQVFAHTLYRYLVLFAASPDFANEYKDTDNNSYFTSPVWKVVVETLDLHSIVAELPHRGGEARPKSVTAAAKKFRDDINQWSIHHGTNPTMQRARKRLKDLGLCAENLLMRMLHFDPKKRCTMFEVINSPMFELLRDSSFAASAHNRHYHRNSVGLPGV